MEEVKREQCCKAQKGNHDIIPDNFIQSFPLLTQKVNVRGGKTHPQNQSRKTQKVIGDIDDPFSLRSKDSGENGRIDNGKKE
jgi:hypothetical protein